MPEPEARRWSSQWQNEVMTCRRWWAELFVSRRRCILAGGSESGNVRNGHGVGEGSRRRCSDSGVNYLSNAVIRFHLSVVTFEKLCLFQCYVRYNRWWVPPVNLPICCVRGHPDLMVVPLSSGDPMSSYKPIFGREWGNVI